MKVSVGVNTISFTPEDEEDYQELRRFVMDKIQRFESDENKRPADKHLTYLLDRAMWFI